MMLFIPDGMSAFARNAFIGDFILGWADCALIIFFRPCSRLLPFRRKMRKCHLQARTYRQIRAPVLYAKFRSMRLTKFGPQLSHTGGENDS